MITRVHNKVVFECDRCAEALHTEEPDFKDALEILRGEGWVANKVGDQWQHRCAECGPRK